MSLAMLAGAPRLQPFILMIDNQQKVLLEKRQRLLGPMSTFYDEPLHLVRGEGVRVWDANGREYLDCYNNVPHVGHCHPRVVEAISRQAATLNTHTRYLHETILNYVERLTATFDKSLSSAIIVPLFSARSEALPPAAVVFIQMCLSNRNISGVLALVISGNIAPGRCDSAMRA